ncbi:uncharacterized protein [Porites lutea]|uniref:uncharacterized protein isoform X2 n=1 Tax=Porites lutea TaxID=51062 RepID=UPI003CC59FD2
MSEESFSQLSRSLGTFLGEMNEQDRDAASTNGQPNGQPTGLGNLGPVFTAQTNVRSGSKSSGAKPTRTFLWLGSNASNSQGQVEGKRIKFDKSFNEMEMLSLLKREFKEIGNASTIRFLKAKPHGNHALSPVGTNLSGKAVAEEFKTSSTRVFLSHDLFADNMPSTTATSVALASTSTATVTSIATATATTTSVTSGSAITAEKENKCIKGEFGPSYKGGAFPVGTIVQDLNDRGLYEPGLLHSDQLLQPLGVVLGQANVNGLPFIGVSFKSLCQHIYKGPRIAVVVVLNNRDTHLSHEECQMLSDLKEVCITEKLLYDPDPLIWISDQGKREGRKALQIVGGQGVQCPQILILAPSLRGSTVPMLVERFSEWFTWTELKEALTKAKETLDLVHLARDREKQSTKETDLTEKTVSHKPVSCISTATTTVIDLSHDRGDQSDKCTTGTVVDSDEGDMSVNCISKSVVIDLSTPENDKSDMYNPDLEMWIREQRALRVQPEDPAGVEVRVLTPLGMWKRKIPKTAFYQEVYDWLGADFKIPLFFILVHQATNNMVHVKQKIETQRHVLKVIKKDASEMQTLMEREEVIFSGTYPPNCTSLDSTVESPDTVNEQNVERERKKKRKRSECKDSMNEQGMRKKKKKDKTSNTKNVQGLRKMKKKKEKKRIGNLDIEDNKLDKGIVISLLVILYTPSVFSLAKSLQLILKISSTYILISCLLID